MHQGVSSSRSVVFLELFMVVLDLSWESSVELIALLKAALVVDPVMVSTSGDVLAGSSILPVFRYSLNPSIHVLLYLRIVHLAYYSFSDHSCGCNSKSVWAVFRGWRLPCVIV